MGRVCQHPGKAPRRRGLKQDGQAVGVRGQVFLLQKVTEVDKPRNSYLDQQRGTQKQNNLKG